MMLTIVKGDKDLCKKADGKGGLLGYQKAYHYQAELREVNSLHELSRVLTELESQKRKAVLRDHPKETGIGRRIKERFEQQALPWLCLDWDQPAPDGCPDYVENPEQAITWMIEHHWPMLRGVGMHWQLGNSAGIIPQSEKLSIHMWVWLDQPVLKCSKWLAEHMFDPSMTNPVQIHYTASPLGVNVPRRSGFIEGSVLAGVSEDPPPTRTGIKFSQGYVCTEADIMNMAGELAALEPKNGARHEAIRSWVIRAVTVSYPSVHEDAVGWLIEHGRDRVVAESEIARMVDFARTGLENGSIEPDIMLRPDLGFDDMDEAERLDDEQAKAQAVALGCDSLLDGLDKAPDRYEWLSKNVGRLAKLDPVGLARIKDKWGKGVSVVDKAIRNFLSEGAEEEINWEALATRFLDERVRPLILVDDEWYDWNGTHYERTEGVWVKKELSGVIPNPTTARVANAYQQLQFAALRRMESEPVGTPFTNGRLMPDGQLVPHAPENGGRYCLEFAYDPDATCPTWERCLGEWFEDQERPLILRQWMNYLLTGRDDIQKIMLFMGTQRGGKGTILNVMQALIGHDNYSTPSMGSFASEFGLESSLGKRVLFISDAHLPPRDRSTILDRLKSISGKDRIDVNRKNRLQLKGVRLGQIIIACNQMGDIEDESNALIDRYSIIQFTESFLGKEDAELGSKLKNELPGIFNWAMDCSEFRRFHEDRLGLESKEEMTFASNPVRAWGYSACEYDPFGVVTTDDLYTSFRAWCVDNSLNRVPTKNVFVRSFRAVFPKCESGKIRVGSVRCKTIKNISLKNGCESDEDDF